MTRGDVFTVYSLSGRGRPIVFVVATLVVVADFSWDAEVRAFPSPQFRPDLRHGAFVRSLIDRGLAAPCTIRQINIGDPGCLDDRAELRSTIVGGETLPRLEGSRSESRTFPLSRP